MYSDDGFPHWSQGVRLYVAIADRLYRPAAIHRPYGDSRIVIALLRRGCNPEEMVPHSFPLLEPCEQAPWRRGFFIPPWPANVLDYVGPDVIATEENIPHDLRMPPEVDLPPEWGLP